MGGGYGIESLMMPVEGGSVEKEKKEKEKKEEEMNT